MPQATDQIDMYHQRVIIDFFRQVMTMEQRERFMREHPAAYNDMFAGAKGPIIKVVRTEDGEEI